MAREQFSLDHLLACGKQGQTLKAYAQTHGCRSLWYEPRSDGRVAAGGHGKSSTWGVEDPDLFVAMALFEEGVGPDRVSNWPEESIELGRYPPKEVEVTKRPTSATDPTLTTTNQTSPRPWASLWVSDAD